MAWWGDVLALLRAEWRALEDAGGAAPAEPESVRRAQVLLRRTARELREAQARAEASRRRLQRAQAQLESLTRAPAQDRQYQSRLTDLAHAVSHESDLAGSFEAHIAQLGALHARVERELRGFERDLDMARTARAASDATRAAAPQSACTRKPPSGAGFRRARSKAVMDRLGELPRKDGHDED